MFITTLHIAIFLFIHNASTAIYNHNHKPCAKFCQKPKTNRLYIKPTHNSIYTIYIILSINQICQPNIRVQTLNWIMFARMNLLLETLCYNIYTIYAVFQQDAMTPHAIHQIRFSLQMCLR